jgi:predicted nucleic acid-binding protein
MSFFLDTDTCSLFLKGDPTVVSRFLQYGVRLNLSVVTVVEHYSGALLSKASPRHLPAITPHAQDLAALDVTIDVAKTYETIRAPLLDRSDTWDVTTRWRTRSPLGFW